MGAGRRGAAGGRAGRRARPAAAGGRRAALLIRSDQGGRGRLFFLLGNMCKEVPRGNGVIFIVESHLSGFCFRYLLTAHGRKGVGVKIR